MREQARDKRAALPAVDRVLRAPGATALIERHGRSLVTEAVRDALAERRSAGKPASVEAIVAASGAALARLMQASQRPVFNLTGTVLHTNLGRAPLPEEAVMAAAAAMRAPSTLEYDLDQRPARRARRSCRGVAHAADRRRGRARGQQQRRRAAPRAERAGAGARDDRLARRIDRDRRLVPAARHHAARRHPAARGRHDQPHPSQGFRRCDRAGDGADPQGAYQQLPGPGLYRGGAGGAARRARAAARAAVCRGSRQRHARRSRALGPAARADRRAKPSNPAPISSPSAATSCWADRRPGSSSAAPISSPRWRRTR